MKQHRWRRAIVALVAMLASVVVTTAQPAAASIGGCHTGGSAQLGYWSICDWDNGDGHWEKDRVVIRCYKLFPTVITGNIYGIWQNYGGYSFADCPSAYPALYSITYQITRLV